MAGHPDPSTLWSRKKNYESNLGLQFPYHLFDNLDKILPLNKISHPALGKATYIRKIQYALISIRFEKEHRRELELLISAISHKDIEFLGDFGKLLRLGKDSHMAGCKDDLGNLRWSADLADLNEKSCEQEVHLCMRLAKAVGHQPRFFKYLDDRFAKGYAPGWALYRFVEPDGSNEEYFPNYCASPVYIVNQEEFEDLDGDQGPRWKLPYSHGRANHLLMRSVGARRLLGSAVDEYRQDPAYEAQEDSDGSNTHYSTSSDSEEDDDPLDFESLGMHVIDKGRNKTIVFGEKPVPPPRRQSTRSEDVRRQSFDPRPDHLSPGGVHDSIFWKRMDGHYQSRKKNAHQHSKKKLDDDKAERALKKEEREDITYGTLEEKWPGKRDDEKQEGRPLYDEKAEKALRKAERRSDKYGTSRKERLYNEKRDGNGKEKR